MGFVCSLHGTWYAAPMSQWRVLNDCAISFDESKVWEETP